VRIIGVIDLLRGRAVHARGGRRDLYAPVHRSAGIVIDGSPAALARLYVETFGLPEIYVADLDAIEARTIQAKAIGDIGALGASLWVDAGVANPNEANTVLEAGAHMLVAGLETLTSFDALADICARSGSPVAFSLDLRGGTPMNAAMASHSPEELARRAVAAGAHAVIVLDVARVGGAAGPDFDLLRRIHSAVPETDVFAGGGIRDIHDLRRLEPLGCAGALIATAVHEGRVLPTDIAAVAARRVDRL
jgi:phosphoribosylformimino-5-aminoimidazole carboxamide ribotide isomerase